MSEEPINNDATQPMSLGGVEHKANKNDSSTEPTGPVSIGGNPETTRPIAIKPSKSKASVVVDTVPNPETTGLDSLPPKPASKAKKSGRGWWILAGILFVLALTAIGGTLGYNSGINERLARQNSQVAMAAATQFQLGLDDMNNGRYDMARSRFEYVIKLDPSFPGVKQKLTEVIIALIPTLSPTPSSTPTPEYTPTPDLRGEEELFKQIQVQLTNQKWDTAIVTIESLRTKNLKYKTVEVDGFYYIALRYRGVDKILRLGDLEGGMYDLALAERFGPLDRDADSYRLWARYYVTGASFWQVDWEKAVFYFGQVGPMLPNLRDASNMLAIDRYREAVNQYANKLANDGDFCKASQLLDKLYVNNYRNATFEPLATRAFRECHPPTDTPEPTKATLTGTATVTLTPTLTLAGTKLTPAASSATPTPTLAGPTATTAPSPTNGPAATTQVPSATATPTTGASVPTATPTPTPKPPTATLTFTPTK